MVVVFAVSAFAEADPPVPVLIYGPNPAIERRLDELPRTRSYEMVTLGVTRDSTGRKLMVTLSGGIGVGEVLPILGAMRLYSMLGTFESPWQLAIHGSNNYAARVIVTTPCGKMNWLVVYDNSGWVDVGGPALQTPCFHWRTD